jgi:hypothetical protein
MFYPLFVEVDSLSILYTYVIRAGRGQCILVVVGMITASVNVEGPQIHVPTMHRHAIFSALQEQIQNKFRSGHVSVGFPRWLPGSHIIWSLIGPKFGNKCRRCVDKCSHKNVLGHQPQIKIEIYGPMKLQMASDFIRVYLRPA